MSTNQKYIEEYTALQKLEFYFDGNRLFSNSYSGLVLVKIDQAIPTGTTTTLPIIFNSTNGKQNVTTYNDADMTVGT